MNFQEYLTENDIVHLKAIKIILLNSEFEITSRHSGHDYEHNTSIGSIKFNNLSMEVNSTSLTHGLRNGNRVYGNTIEFNELTLVQTNKISILKRIKVITETKEEFQLEHEDLLDQLDFLRLSKTTTLDKIKFREFKIKRITEGKDNPIQIEV